MNHQCFSMTDYWWLDRGETECLGIKKKVNYRTKFYNNFNEDLDTLNMAQSSLQDLFYEQKIFGF